MRATRQKEKAEIFDSMRDMTEEYEEEHYRGLRPEDVFLVAMFSPRAQEAWRRGWEEREREGD